MTLTGLELQGFKSFPDRTSLRFGEGITGVVGPNGSGKSNIADAVRWVLGEQSSKSLRGAKMEDVVFSGTDARRAQGFAQVTLKLDNRDRSLHRDEDEVCVTRKYYRSGESEYLLGGQTVRLKDVHELFMDTGLGKGGYSMVSQGRVAELVSSKSHERRDMLEEAAGIAHFRVRRLDAERRLAQTEENLVRLRDIVGELEERVGPLKIQSEKAKKFLELSATRKKLEIALWLLAIDKNRARLREQENKLHLANLQHAETEEQLADLAAQIEASFTAGQSITARIEHLQSGSARREEEAAQLEGQVSVAENSIAHHNAALQRLQNDKEEAASSLADLTAQADALEAQIDALDTALQTGEKELAALTAQTEALRRAREALFARDKELAEEAAAATEILHALDLSHSRAHSAQDEVRERLALLSSDAGARLSRVDELIPQEAATAQDLAAARETASAAGNAIAGHEMLLISKKKRADAAKAALDELSAEQQKMQTRLRLLEELERNMEGYGGAVRAVLTEGKRGALRGIHGTLSQLIHVQAKYATAIETALGAAMQFVVVETDDDAKRAVRHLKEKRAGRATFLPLSTIRGRDLNERGVEDCLGFVDYADALVEADTQYREILRAQLARTVVCESMDDALPMARRFSHRFRIVTLDGQVLNAGGSITGGSKIQGAGFLTRQAEIDKLGAQLKKSATAYAEAQESVRTAGAEHAAAAAALDGAKADWQNASEEILRRESAHRLIAERLQAARDALENMEAERTAAQTRLADLTDESEQISAKIAAQTLVTTALAEKRHALEDERAASLEKLEEAAHREQALRLRQAEGNKELSAKGDALASLQERAENHQKRAGDLDAERAQITEAIVAANASIAALKGQVLALRADSGENKDEIAALLDERSAHEAAGAKLRATERELTATREGLGGEVARLEERRGSLQNAINDTQNKLFEEYQLTEREAARLGLDVGETADAQRSLDSVKQKIRSLGNVNLSAVEEYQEVSARYEFLTAQCADVEESRQALGELIRELTGKMSERFREQFAKVQSAFVETFADLFGGGRAELVLDDPLDPLECDVLLRVQPPGKNVQNIDLLSGGEKGLAAIALLFAILKINPAPFCIFDEVEAALDDVNVVRYAKYVRRMCGATQFILITHRRGTMEEADVLYGVTMQEEGVSKLLEMHTTEIANELGI
ncbi:MAG: chromosome segregation protein SMC [Oscillospiraceae bacterium]|jgi:chromosome segregation protein|nr:chromosome segregation protein SMC [Oscillospiraceae bacterium]